MVGENIKRLRTEAGMTQKDLADKLFVTPQAVSRWEKDIVEPNLSTIAEMSKLFGVSTNVILGIEEVKEVPKVVEKQAPPPIINIDVPKQVLAVCDMCKTPIYNPKDIHKRDYATGEKVLCPNCIKKLDELKANRYSKYSKKQRIKSYIIGGIILVALTLFNIIGAINSSTVDPLAMVVMFLFPLGLFTFVGCMCFKNNFVEDMMSWAWTSGFVRMPGLIFDLSLDGIIWLITVKLFLWILTYAISIVVTIAVFIISVPLSLFTYPFALVKSIKHPDDVSTCEMDIK